MITGVGVLVIQTFLSSEDHHIDHYGDTMTASLASQAIEPFLAEDGIHLGVLANRLVELPEINGVSFHTMEERTLALSGDVTRAGRSPRPVAHDDAVLGFVRLYVDERAFNGGEATGLLPLGVIWMLLVPLAALTLGQLTPREWLPRKPAAQKNDSLILPEPEPQISERIWLRSTFSIS